MEKLISRIRYFHFISGVLVSQQADPLCSHCKAFANTVTWTREGISKTRPDGIKIPQDILMLLSEAEQRTTAIIVPVDAMGQKKAGNCMMPKGVCFVKIPKSIMEKL
jgi:hypothetical protein